MLKKILLSSTLVVSTLFTSVVCAAGFQVSEQSAANIGTANAGSAVSDNASMVFFNPAGMAFVSHPEISGSLVGILPQISFKPVVATDANGNDILGTSNSNSPGRTAYIPSFYAVYPLNQSFAFGMGVTVPFGLSTDYDDNSAARYFATKSALRLLILLRRLQLNH